MVPVSAKMVIKKLTCSVLHLAVDFCGLGKKYDRLLMVEMEAVMLPASEGVLPMPEIWKALPLRKGFCFCTGGVGDQVVQKSLVELNLATIDDA